MSILMRENPMVLGNDMDEDAIPKEVYICFDCGENIYEGDLYFRVSGETYCRDCIIPKRASFLEAI